MNSQAEIVEMTLSSFKWPQFQVISLFFVGLPPEADSTDR